MKKIIGIIKPFEGQQTLLVYEDGNKIDMNQTTIEKLNESLFLLMETHDVYRVDLAGPKKYLKGLSDQIQRQAAAKYENSKEIEINII